MASHRLVDNWETFRSAMDGRFQRIDEAFGDFSKMKSLKYDGPIEVYLLSVEALNVRANVSGAVLKHQLRQGLPDAILVIWLETPVRTCRTSIISSWRGTAASSMSTRKCRRRRIRPTPGLVPKAKSPLRRPNGPLG